MAETSNASKSDLKRRLTQKLLMPVVATAASAAASYAAKKAPQFLENTVLPRLREAANGAGGAAHDLPSRAKSVANGAGDVAERLTDRAKAVAAGSSSSGARSNGHGGSDRARKALSKSELEQRRKQRAESRTARRKASS